MLLCSFCFSYYCGSRGLLVAWGVSPCCGMCVPFTSFSLSLVPVYYHVDGHYQSSNKHSAILNRGSGPVFSHPSTRTIIIVVNTISAACNFESSCVTDRLNHWLPIQRDTFFLPFLPLSHIIHKYLMYDTAVGK